MSKFKALKRSFACSVVTTCSLTALACSDASEGRAPEDALSAATLQLTQIPSSVQCFRAVAKGTIRTETRDFDVAAGASSQSFALDRLPVGSVEFAGFAFSVPCTQVTSSLAAEWVSDPVIVPVLRGAVAEVLLHMKRNGRSSVGADFDDDEVCLTDDQPCVENSDCCAGSCLENVCRPQMCTQEAMVNLALNPSCSGFPSPFESSAGWGGGSFPCETIDGLHSYSEWNHGLAFTGGHQTAQGGPPYIEAAGVRHMVVDFGAPQAFEKVVLWWHGQEHTPEVGALEVWDGSQWLGIDGVERLYGTMHEEGMNSGFSDSDIYTFPAVTGSKVRYTFDNSGNNITGTLNVHGWLFEAEIFGCPSN